MSPVLGRYDDIIASLVCQKAMRHLGTCVHFGEPFVFQQRNEHDLIKDLKAELWGMENILAVAEFLDRPLSRGTSVNYTIQQWLNEMPFGLFPETYRRVYGAFLMDCSKVMGE